MDKGRRSQISKRSWEGVLEKKIRKELKSKQESQNKIERITGKKNEEENDLLWLRKNDDNKTKRNQLKIKLRK